MSLVGVAIYTPVGEAESVRTLVSLPDYRHRAPAAAPTGMRQIPDADDANAVSQIQRSIYDNYNDTSIYLLFICFISTYTQ